MVITKVGAIIVNSDRKMLVVRKNVPGRSTFIIPGGKPEANETDQDTCERELFEELGVKTLSLTYFGSFSEPSEFEDAMVDARVYRVDIEGSPRPSREIVELDWIDGVSLANGADLGSILTKHVIPELVRQGVVNAGDAGDGRN